MNTWILIIVLNFQQPLAPAVVPGFVTEADCQAAAEHLHSLETRLAPSVVTVCVPARVAAK